MATCKEHVLLTVLFGKTVKVHLDTICQDLWPLHVKLPGCFNIGHFVKLIRFQSELCAIKVPLVDSHLALGITARESLTLLSLRSEAAFRGDTKRCAAPDSMKWRHFLSPPLSSPPSAFREVGQLTVCGCQDCIVRARSPPPSLPLFQCGVSLPLER